MSKVLSLSRLPFFLVAIACGQSANPVEDPDGSLVEPDTQPPENDASPEAPDAEPAAPLDPSSFILNLADELATSSGAEVAIAVTALEDDAIAVAVNGDEPHISASSAKAFWTAAALDTAGIAAVAPLAPPTFELSDNFTAGSIIDLVGPNEVNDWLWGVGQMPTTALTSWGFGQPRVATNSPRLLGNNNYTTANDSLRFLVALNRGELLGSEETTQLLEWMRLSPRADFGGWTGTKLPESVQQSLSHKAGWLSPGCCSQPYHTLIDIGIMTLPSGTQVAYALLFRFGDWEAEQEAMSRAGCEIYNFYATANADPIVECAEE